MSLTDRERMIAREAADDAARRVLREIGIDPDSVDSVDDYHADRRYLRRHREASEAISGWVRWAAISAVVTGGLAMLWLGIEYALSKFQ